MEKQTKIRTADKQYIYGRLSGSSRQPLFIVVHGLAGSMDEDFYVQATRWFTKKGYATFRFNLYGAEKDARQMMDSTLATHASDIDAVVKYFRAKKFKKIFLAGHSFGGPSILLSNEQDFDAAVLWDPSYNISFMKMAMGAPNAKFNKELSSYVMRWGTNPVIGQAMVEEADTLDWKNLTINFRKPLQIIAAGKSALLTGAKQYFRTANNPKNLVIISEATHYFNDTEKMRNNLFNITHDWLKKSKVR